MDKELRSALKALAFILFCILVVMVFLLVSFAARAECVAPEQVSATVVTAPPPYSPAPPQCCGPEMATDGSLASHYHSALGSSPWTIRVAAPAEPCELEIDSTWGSGVPVSWTWTWDGTEATVVMETMDSYLTIGDLRVYVEAAPACTGRLGVGWDLVLGEGVEFYRVTLTGPTQTIMETPAPPAVWESLPCGEYDVCVRSVRGSQQSASCGTLREGEPPLPWAVFPAGPPPDVEGVRRED